MEIYAAVAKAGLVVVPINFRLIGSEVRYIVENSEARASSYRTIFSTALKQSEPSA